MKTINNLNLANLYNSKILLGTVLSLQDIKQPNTYFLVKMKKWTKILKIKW